MVIRWRRCVAHFGFRYIASGELAYKACAWCESADPFEPAWWHARPSSVAGEHQRSNVQPG